MYSDFIGSELRLARKVNQKTLEDVAEHVGKTRQYISKLETGQAQPTDELWGSLAEYLQVMPEMFEQQKSYLVEEQFHFRSQRTTKESVKHAVQTRGELVIRLVNILDKYLQLPKFSLFEMSLYDFDLSSVADIERLAEKCRDDWGLGFGAISDMHRLAENRGIIVTSFPSMDTEVDALSVDCKRPIIVRSECKMSICRHRFDIGHEIGHLIMHQGTPTGDRITESQANRFSSALLIPRSMMAKFFPRPSGLRSARYNWNALSEFKLHWRVSKAAILYRARQLDLITEDQYVSGVVTLRTRGESKGEIEDDKVQREQPELLQNSFKVLAEKKRIYGEDIAKELKITVQLLDVLVGFETPKKPRTLQLVS